jgi:hypothetical protein
VNPKKLLIAAIQSKMSSQLEFTPPVPHINIPKLLFDENIVFEKPLARPLMTKWFEKKEILQFSGSPIVAEEL